MKTESLVVRLLRKNTSAARVAAFVVSNFIGLAIVLGALQFYGDARSIWDEEDSFIKTDYLVVNKRVTSANTLGAESTSFTEAEISDIEAQPWVRKVGRFSANDFRVAANISQQGRDLSTYMFFESIPDEFVDVPKGEWTYRPGSDEVPIIISKDYLTLYNFGFATSAGLPQLSEGLMSGIPMNLTMRSDDGTRIMRLHGRVAGYSNRLNTILVPQEFMEESNRRLGTGRVRQPSRLIIDVNSPGDVAISKYLEEHGYELAGDKKGSSAAFMLKVVIGVVLAVGAIITILSIFILLLSISLILEKNRMTLHRLMMLGYDAGAVGRPYRMLVIWASVAASLLALLCVVAMRSQYIAPIRGLGGGDSPLWVVPAAGALLTILAIGFNLVAVKRRVDAAWRVSN